MSPPWSLGSGIFHTDFDVRIRGRTLAQLYSLGVGLGLVVSGLAGFLVDSSFVVGGQVHGHALVLFETNGWHNLLHLTAGALGLAAFSSPRLSRSFAVGWGATAAVLASWAAVTTYPAFGLIPGGTGGILFHLFDASTGVLTWLLSAPMSSMSREV